MKPKGTITVPLAVYNATPPTLSDGDAVELQCDVNGNLRLSGGGGGGGGGGAATIADGADVCEGATTDTAVTSDANGTLSGKLRGLVKIFASVWDSLNARLNVAVQNTPNVAVTNSPTVTANAGTNLNTSSLALETGGNLAAAKIDLDTLAGIVSGSKAAIKSADGDQATIGATTDAAVSSDANGTLSGKLRGLVKIFASVWDSGNSRLNVAVQNTPNVAVTNSPTVTANAGTNLNTSSLALETGGNLAAAKSDLDTLAGIVSGSKAAIKSADGDQATIGATTDTAVTSDANGTLSAKLRGLVKIFASVWDSGNSRLNVAVQNTVAENLTQVGGSAVATAGTGIQKVGISDTSGNAITSVGGWLEVYLAGAGTNLAVSPYMGVYTLGTVWNSSTALNATQTLYLSNSVINSGGAGVAVELLQTGTATAGAIVFEVTFDSLNWITISADAVVDPTSATFAQISLPYSLQSNTNKIFVLLPKGAQGMRIRLSTQITGSCSVSVYAAFYSYAPLQQVSVTNTPNVTATISGTPNVAVTNTPNVAVTNTPTVVNTPAGASTGNKLTFKLVNAVTAKTQVASVAAALWGVHLYNPNTSTVYVQVFNKTSASVTLGTTTPDFVLVIPAVATLDDLTLATGIILDTALTFAPTTTPTGSTAPASGITGSLFYI